MMSIGRDKTGSKPEIGLYTYEQTKNTTPFQYFAQVVVGLIVLAFGTVLAIEGMRLSGIAIMVMGVFFAHAGVIFWFRRLRKAKSRRG